MAPPSTKFRRVHADLRGRILGGHLSPGDRLPSHAALVIMYGPDPARPGKKLISQHVTRRVYDALVAEGLVEARSTHGYFVTDRTGEASEVRPATERERRRLQLLRGAVVHVAERLHLTGGRPSRLVIVVSPTDSRTPDPEDRKGTPGTA